ncbi:MAG TPA: precorrin-6A reductase [Feifaniaceae bacterium]|nr:precorrin-6A reductase [Feifaniaceae bacterium]
MAEILLFGGTSEGRALATLLKSRNISTLVCVATEYGESLLDIGGSVSVHTGRLDEDAMAALIKEHGPRLVLDATHPYANAVSRNIRAACESANTAYLRVRRESAAEEGLLTFPTMDALIAWLNTTDGVIFSGLGAKEARALTAVTGFESRVWLRILPFAEGLNACIGAGFPAKHIICMQGPFSKELNAAMFRAAGADILVTKESGAAGGFLEKLAAARACGMRVAVLERPDEEAGLTLEEAKRRIEDDVL